MTTFNDNRAGTIQTSGTKVEVFDPGIYGFQHAPIYDQFSAFGGMVVAGERLLIVYRRGASHVGHGDYGDIVSRYSTDGVNWTDPATIDDEAGVDLRNVSLGMGNSGRVILMYTRMDPDLDEQMYLSMVYRYSDDDGDSWSAAQTLNDGAMVPNTSSASTYGAVVVGDGGKLMQTWYGGVTAAADGIYSSFLATSVDNGATWSAPVTILAGGGGTSYDETSIVYLGSNNLVGLIRSELGNTFRQVKSTNNGVNWTDQGDVSFDTWSTRSPPYLCTYDDEANVVCYYANRTALRLRRATATASGLLSSTSAWTLQPDLAEISSYDAGYPAVIHYTDSELGWGWYYDSGTIYFFRSTDLLGVPTTPPIVKVRQRPSLSHSVYVTAPNSNRTYRWGEDTKDPSDAVNSLSFGSGQPGGYDEMSAVVPRKHQLDYIDLEPFSDVEVHNSLGDTVWEGRLRSIPRAAGDNFAISPSAVGHQAQLEDNKNAAEIFVDMDFRHWGAASDKVQLTFGTTWSYLGSEVKSAPTGGTVLPPGLWTGFEEVGAGVKPWSIGMYDAGPSVHLGKIEWAFEQHPNTPSGPDDWGWGLAVDDAEDFASYEVTADFQGGATSGAFTPAAATNRFAMAFFQRASPTVAAGTVNMGVWWTLLAVTGRHGLTTHSVKLPGGMWTPGVYASDVIDYVVDTYTDLNIGTVDPTTFPIPQLEFRDTTPAEMVKGASKFHIFDWFVANGKTFHWRQRGTYGRNWLARVGPGKLDETGIDAERVITDVLVRYQDVDGSTKTVGPVGSNADTEDASLHDADTLNPATLAGIANWAVLDMGEVSTPAAAIQVGSRYLEEMRQIDHSGRAELTGWVMDDHGITLPYSSVFAGDTVSFLDAADHSPRRIVKASHNHSSRSVALDLDAPPEGHAALLEQLGVGLVNIAGVGAGAEVGAANGRPAQPTFGIGFGGNVGGGVYEGGRPGAGGNSLLETP